MTLSHKRVQVARPAHGNFSARGVVGTAYLAVGGRKVAGLYVLDPDHAEDLEKVECLLFSVSELKALP